MSSLKSFSLIVITVLLSSFFHDPVLGMEPQNVNTGLTVDEISKLSIAENLGIQILKKDIQVQEFRNQSAKAVYDTIWTGDLQYERDESPNASVFAANRTDEHIVSTALSKKLPIGSDIKAEWITNRNESDSSFVSLNPSYRQTAEFTLVQPLLKNAFGLQERKRIQSIALDVERFNYKRLIDIERKLMEVRSQYWSLASAMGIVSIEERGVKDANEFLKVSQEKMNLGLLEEPDILAAKANVKQRETDLYIARSEVELASNRLKRALNLGLDIGLSLSSEPWPELLLLKEDESLWVDAAMKNRNERKDALLRVENMNLSISMAENSLWPQIDLEASLRLNGLDRESDIAAESAWDGEDLTSYFGLRWTWPLELTEERSQLNSAKLEKVQSLTQVQDIESMIRLEVKNAYISLATAYTKVLNRQEIVKLQQSKLEAEMKRFDQGRSSSDVIISFQTDVLLSLKAKLNAWKEYSSALDDFNRSKGVLLVPYMASIDQ